MPRFHARFRVTFGQFAAKFPISGGALTVQQSDFRQKKRSDANSSQAAERGRGVFQPCRSSPVTGQPRSDRQNGVGASKTCADAILPKTSEVFCQDLFHSTSLI